MSHDYTTPWDELVAAGRCDCGRLLADHPPIERPVRITPHAGRGGRRDASQQPTVFHRGRAFVIKAEHQR